MWTLCKCSRKKSVGALTGVDQVKVNLAEGLVDIAFDEAKVSLDQIKETIDDQGYDVK